MAKFCGKCGARLDETTALCPYCDAKKATGMNKKKKTRLIVCLVIIVTVLIAAAGCVTAVLLLNKGSSDAAEESELSEEEQIRELMETFYNYAFFDDVDVDAIFKLLPSELYDYLIDNVTEDTIQELQESYEENIEDARDEIYSEYGSDVTVTVEITSVEDTDDGDTGYYGVLLEKLLGYLPEEKEVQYTVTISGTDKTETTDNETTVWKIDSYGWLWLDGFSMLLDAF